MNRNRKSLVKRISRTLSNNNLEGLHQLKSLKNDCTWAEEASNFQKNPHLSEKRRKIIEDIMTIDKRSRYQMMANQCIPRPQDLSRNQIERISFIVKEGVYLSTIHEKAFSTKKFPVKQKEYKAQYRDNNLPRRYLSTGNKNEKHQLLLSGGAVRDILFLKKSTIKDLDFCMAFTKDGPAYEKDLNDQEYINYIHPASIFRMMKDGEVSQEHQNCIEYINVLSQIKEKITHMSEQEQTNVLNSFEFSFFVRYHINQQNMASEAIYVGIHDEALLNRIGWEEYVNDNMTATIKTNGLSGIPIDILVSSASCDLLISSFDFAICKSSVDFTRAYEYFKNKEMNEENCVKFFFSRLNVPMTVIRDVYYEELTISKQYIQRMDKIFYFIEKHFPRLKNKFPSFEINLETSIDSPLVDTVREIVRTKENIQKVITENLCNEDNAISTEFFKV